MKRAAELHINTTAFFLGMLLLPLFSLSQQRLLENGSMVVACIIENNDTLPTIQLETVDVVAYLTAEDIARLQRFHKLKKNILKVWPYAKMAAVMMRDMNNHLLTLKSEKEKKKYIKISEKEMRTNFETELKGLTYSQGRLLIKLIDRETDHTTYQIVKQFRGSFQAMFWQGLAKVFGSNLKTEYDSEGEDRQIEFIIQSLEKGELR